MLKCFRYVGESKVKSSVLSGFFDLESAGTESINKQKIPAFRS